MDAKGKGRRGRYGERGGQGMTEKGEEERG
jgi:hypothetical protein